MSNISNIDLFYKFAGTVAVEALKNKVNDKGITDGWLIFKSLNKQIDYNRTYGWNVQHITDYIEKYEKIAGGMMTWDCPREYVWVDEKQADGMHVHTKVYLDNDVECARYGINNICKEIKKYPFSRTMKGYLEVIGHKFNTLNGYRAYASRKYWDEYREGKAMYELVEKVKANNWNKFEAHKNLKNEEYELLLKECPEVFRTERKKQEVRTSTLKKVEAIKEKIASNIALTNSERVFKSTHKALFN